MEITMTINKAMKPEDLRNLLRKLGMAYSEGERGRADSFADIAQKVGNEHGIYFGSDTWIERNQDGFFDGFKGHEALFPVLEAKAEAYKERWIRKLRTREARKEGQAKVAA